jgi:hypothetical protein
MIGSTPCRRAVVVDDRDLLALELVPAALRLGDVLQHRVAGHPVVAHEREVPLEDAAVGGVAAAIARGDHRDLVAGHLLGQREGDAGGQRLEHRRAAVLALQALVALDAAVGRVGRLALLDQGLHAVDAAARIDQLHVVVVAVGPGRGVGRHRSGAAREHGEELLLVLRQAAPEASRPPAPAVAIATARVRELHFMGLPPGVGVNARDGAGIGRLAATQWGKGHRRIFSLAIDHSRASPCGSTIRKKTISPPKIISSVCEISAALCRCRCEPSAGSVG